MFRKKKTYQWFAHAAIISALSVTTACSDTSKGGTDNPKEGVEGKETAASSVIETDYNPLGKYDPPIEVTAVRASDPAWKFENGETIEKNGWNQLYEQELGIKLKYQWVSDQFDQKMNVTMASGKLPDIMPIGVIHLKQLAEADQLEDLKDALDNYGSEELKSLLQKDGGIAIRSATVNGKLLALPLMGNYTDSAPLLWIRTDWLKKLNLPEPKSMDDVLAIAEAFTKQDPDGNGKNDTYGLGLTKELWSSLAGSEGFFNSYHAYPNTWLKDDSGKLIYGSIQPEMKIALAKLQELYKNGIIDREFAVKDADKVGQAAMSDKLGLMFGVHWIPLYLQDGKNRDPEMQWTAYPLPSIDDKASKPQASYGVGLYFAVRKGMEHPEAVVKMMNAFLKSWNQDPEKSAQYPQESIRVNGEVEKWKYALVYNANPTQNLEAYQRVNEAIKKNDESVLDKSTGEPNVYKAIKAYLAGDNSGWGYERIFGEDGAQAIYNRYYTNNGFQVGSYTGAATPAMIEKGATLGKMELETFVKIIMNAAPISDFDKYVENWKKLGGDQITKEINESDMGKS